MTSLIKAINAYRPKLVLGKRVDMKEMIEFIARSTGLNEGTIRQVLIELRDGVIFFNLRGQPVYLECLGTYTPAIDLDGTITIGHRADMTIKNSLNAPGAYKGEIQQRENIGKTSEDLVERWNKEHPEDRVAR
ncbi:hypothetical protein JW964_03565 [candidate division KSB1 bacterium]|nr:hypothetical protein [candidate division KSB1 bacterium]